MSKLILVRHGQSEWNLANRFTGWWDVDLTEKGETEARQAGELMLAKGVLPTLAFTSVQKRAIKTLNLALEACDRLWIPVTRDWHLNERHYGGLTGLDKKETAEKHGEDQVHIWRRSYDIPPPPMEAGSEYDMSKDPRYAGIDIPATESLKLTLERVLPYWHETIAARLRHGTDMVIAAHGNSLRALVKHLFQVEDDDITGVEIPTGNPLLIELGDGLQPTSARYLDGSRATDLPELP